MRSKTLNNFKFESIVSENVGLYPITDEEMTFIPSSYTSSSNLTFIKECNFPYDGTIWKKISVPPIGEDGYSNAYIGRVIIYHNDLSYSTNPIMVLSPWRYRVDWSSSSNRKRYVNSEEEIKIMQSSGYNVKQTGRWHKKLDTCTVIRTRFFTPTPTVGDFRSQYTFDTILYDNGLIEYRYQSLNSSLVLRGTSEYFDNKDVMIYAYDYTVPSSTARSVISVVDEDLKDQDQQLGGKRLTNTALIKTSKASTAWPAKENQGAIYRFVPPTNEIKRTLPRKELRIQDSNSILSFAGMYDDRKTINFNEQIITLPTRLPALYGQSSKFGTSEYQINSSIYLTGVATSTSDFWINNANGFQQNTWEGFSEKKCLEENLKFTDFYLTGTRIEDSSFGFEQSLDHKVKFSFELPVNSQYVLNPSTASLSYYDNRSFGFAKSGELEGFYTYYNAFGDAKGFSAFGLPLAGGYDPNVINPYYKYSLQSYDEPLYSGDVAETISRVVLRTNTNLSGSHSFNSASYSTFSGSTATGIEPIIFHNDLSAPFLLEKAIIEIPICAGPDWLNDTTKANQMISKPYGGGFEYWKFTQEGGPCVTIGLIKENREGKLSSYKYYTSGEPDYVHREIICSGTIIPEKDNTNGYHFVYDKYASGISTDVNLILTGFNVYSNNPSAVITPNNGNYFTGSVLLTLQPQVSNNFYYNYDETITNATSYKGYQLESDEIDLANSNSPGTLVNYKPIGPAGLDQIKDNRQFFGINNSPFNYTTKVVDGEIKKSLSVPNPIKKLNVSLSSSYAAIVNANPTETFANYNVSYVGTNSNTTNSPYLLYPGDRITLFISKYHASEDNRNIIDLNNPSFASSITQQVLKHDIKINTGTIKISLFGSYIKGNKPYTPSLKESLYTSTISKTIGDDPVLDQLELYDDVQLMGTYTDNIILPVSGTLLCGPDYTTNTRDIKFVSKEFSRMRVSSATYGKIIAPGEQFNDYTTTLVKK